MESCEHLVVMARQGGTYRDGGDFYPLAFDPIQKLYSNQGARLSPLHLIFEKCSLNNQVGWTWFLVYFKLELCRLHSSGSKNQVRTIPKIKFIQLLNFSKKKCRSTGGYAHHIVFSPLNLNMFRRAYLGLLNNYLRHNNG